MKYLIFLKSGNYIGVSNFHRVGDEILVTQGELLMTSSGLIGKVEKADKFNILNEDIEKIITFYKTR